MGLSKSSGSQINDDTVNLHIIDPSSTLVLTVFCTVYYNITTPLCDYKRIVFNESAIYTEYSIALMMSTVVVLQKYQVV